MSSGQTDASRGDGVAVRLRFGMNGYGDQVLQSHIGLDNYEAEGCRDVNVNPDPNSIIQHRTRTAE